MEHDSQPEAYYVHVWIRGIHPMLWRRFLVRSDSTLADLHAVLQIGFDWTDFHLHRFRIRKKDYAVPRRGGLGCHDARQIKLGQLHFRINERFLYEYDFGDLWQHQVRIEKRSEIETSRSYPVCVGGQWAGPRRIVGDREPFWTGARLRRGESESCLITYWKTSKPGILKLSITASRSCSLGKSGSCCIALTGAE